MQGRNVSNFEYIVWIGGREMRVRAMTAKEAKLKAVRRLMSQSEQPVSPGAAQEYARQATAQRSRNLRALSAT